MDLFNGLMGYVLARQRVNEDHEQLKVVCTDLRSQVEKDGKELTAIKKDLLCERAAVARYEAEIHTLEEKSAENVISISNTRKEKDDLLLSLRVQEEHLAAKDVELVKCRQELDAERQALTDLRAQYESVVQSRRDLLSAFPNFV